MKTDELISMLSTNLEPVKGGELRIALVISLTVGAVVALCLMLAVLGLPTDTFSSEHFGLKFIGFAFTLGLAAVGVRFLVRSARPGEPERRPLVIIGLLFFAIVSAGGVSLLLTHRTAWDGMIFGPLWAACLICIPLFAIAPFVSLVWALRKGAPTNLRLAGAGAGLVAGALGAAIFVFYHQAASVPFMALWYAGPILLCALIGAMLGPLLLRW
jgi:hypothetical protein